MNDPTLASGFGALSPTPVQVARIGATVRERLAARRRGVLAEWWALLRARPLVNGAWMAVGAAIVLASTPLSATPAIWRWLAERQGGEVSRTPSSSASASPVTTTRWSASWRPRGAAGLRADRPPAQPRYDAIRPPLSRSTPTVTTAGASCPSARARSGASGRRRGASRASAPTAIAWRTNS